MAILRAAWLLLILGVFFAFAAVFFVFTSDGIAAEYYVDNSHPLADDGWSKATNGPNAPWEHIWHAASEIEDGDTVWVKYSSVPYGAFIIDNEGVVFAGYYQTPGDLNSGEGVPRTYEEMFTISTMQPVIDLGNPYGGACIDICGYDYVAISNFTVTNATVGVATGAASWCEITNIIACAIGDVDGSREDHGYGILIDRGGDFNSVYNCVVYNSAGYGIAILGGVLGDNANNNTVRYSRVFCDDNQTQRVSATDYYFVIQDGNDNRIDFCVAERRDGPYGNPAHGGHGFAVMATASRTCMNNIVECSEAKSMSETILMRGKATDNTFRDIVGTNELPWFSIGHISLETGPHGNHFERVRLIDTIWAVRFRVDLTWEPFPETCAKNNEFVNCIFQCRNGFRLESLKHPQYDVEDNSFLACNFVRTPGDGHLFLADRPSSGNTLASCIVTGYELYTTGTSDYSPTQSEFFFYKCCLHNPDSNFPSLLDLGFDNVPGDPMFEDVSLGSDFEILDGSSCIGKGVFFPDHSADFDDDPRGDPPDIGAQEHMANP